MQSTDRRSQALSLNSDRSSTGSNHKPLPRAPPSSPALTTHNPGPRTPRASQQYQLSSAAVILEDTDTSSFSSTHSGSHNRTPSSPNSFSRERAAGQQSRTTKLRNSTASTSTDQSRWSDDIRPLAELSTSPLSTPVAKQTHKLDRAVKFSNTVRLESQPETVIKIRKPLGSPVYERPRQTFHAPKDGYVPKDEICVFDWNSSSDEDGDHDRSSFRLAKVTKSIRPRKKTHTDSRPSSSTSPITRSNRPSIQTSPTARSRPIIPISIYNTTFPAELSRGIANLSFTTNSGSSTHSRNSNSVSSQHSNTSTSTVPTPTSLNFPSPSSTRSSFTQSMFSFEQPESMEKAGGVKRLMRGLKERKSISELKIGFKGRK